jgi:type VI protein secretion system component VasA
MIIIYLFVLQFLNNQHIIQLTKIQDFYKEQSFHSLRDRILLPKKRSNFKSNSLLLTSLSFPDAFNFETVSIKIEHALPKSSDAELFALLNSFLASLVTAYSDKSLTKPPENKSISHKI